VVQDRLTACGPVAAVTFSTGLIAAERGGSLELRFDYTGSSPVQLAWRCRDGGGAVRRRFRHRSHGTAGAYQPAGPELALGEAMFS